MKKPVTKESAFERMAALCSRSEQCESDIYRKLMTLGLAPSDRNEIIEKLKTERFVDDSRFARSYASDKARFSAWGPYKIKMELIKKRIRETFITEAIAKVESSVWKEGLLRCAVGKAKNLQLTGEESRENRNRLYKYLISRGFSSSTSSKAVAYMAKKQIEAQ